MKAASLKDLKTELKQLTKEELVEVTLKLSKHKKETKELLSYLLFWNGDEEGYIQDSKEEMDELFSQLNTSTYYFAKKGTRKILRIVKKLIRFSKQPETEIELLLHFLFKIDNLNINYRNNTVMTNMVEQQIKMIKKSIAKLHEDLQYDYQSELDNLAM